MELMTDQRFRKTIKYLRALLFFGLAGLALATVLYFSLIGYAKLQGPPPLAVPQSTLYLSDDGTVIGESHSGQKRYWVALKDVSPHLINATISIEDKSFFAHNGFDYKRIAGAALADLKAMAKVQGASTITQQYARNLYLEHDKTWKRKATEAMYTLRLEMNYTKDEILEGYLNTIYYGNGAYGVQAASRYYFGKDAKDLSLAEASMLAGIPKGPNIYSPFASFEKAKQRQQTVLYTMKVNGYITDVSAKKAQSEKLELVGKHQHDRLGTAPYFQDAVRNALKNSLNFDDRTISLGGLRVYTTLNLEQQEIAEASIDKMVSEDSDIQAGFVAMNPKNGHVQALVGGRNYEESPFNRAVQAVRQPGSTMKPILYYAALENGFTPSTTMKSQLTTFMFDDGRSEYTPHNFNNKYAEDDITMAQALALSDNVYAVKTHLFLGEDTLIETAKRFGIKSDLSNVPSLALGTSGVRVIEMANAYSILANGGKEVDPVLIKKVENHKGEVIYEYKGEEKEVLKPELASVMTHMLTGIFDNKLNGYSSVTGSTLIKKMTRPYAAKSGTTETDSWMVGYTPQLVSAVWTGYDKGKPIELTVEKSYAKNIWLEFMEKALDDEPAKKFKAAKGTVSVLVDPSNGKLASEGCPVTRETLFVAGTEPAEYCTDHLDHEEHKEEKAEKKKEKKPWYKRLFGR
ncbi:transglycosylase domain-containing protein [Mesobacillus subterraneus]|uniref:PBP1A family penicillin-binding protein n=1 Tax=Mesobacillus subterraneus TaxID=285983 RepID=A0A427TSG1_9BACI|nr:PBP1A family penicillin-binding protein [Mesobacillus subterraneus]RSD27178.1 PBP1A family penicillin-binding protein [Mesobacillus subterraneus]